MIDLNKFNNMEEVLRCYKELLTYYTDEETFDDAKDKIYEELIELRTFFESTKDITRTNRELLEILITAINKHRNEYQLQIISGIKNSAKIYKFNSFDDVEISDKNNLTHWNAVIVAKKDFDALGSISNTINNVSFFGPEACLEFCKDKSLVLYDTFLGEMCIEKYLNTNTCVSKLLNLDEKSGLDKEEIKMVKQEAFKLYKEEYNKMYEKGKTKVKK